MKHRFAPLVLLVITLISQTLSQDNWDRYKLRTLKEITTTLAEKSFKSPDVTITNTKAKYSIILSGDTFPSQIKAIYSGISRKVSEQKKEVISIWLTTYGKPKEYLDLFEDEYLFTEDKTEYWLPVQKQVASYFGEELKKGDTVTLFVAWLGARKEPNKVEHVFLMNEFEAEK